jgi:hypothetical protein
MPKIPRLPRLLSRPNDDIVAVGVFMLLVGALFLMGFIEGLVWP